MYLPRTFRIENPTLLHNLVERYSFGMLLVASPDGELEISHLPFLLDEDVGAHGRLRLHVARANPIWERALAQGRVTAVFGGPHAYVSASWYEAPTEQVPTWNYAVVHATGVPREMNREELSKLLDDLALSHEPREANGWRAQSLTPDFRDQLMQQIVGLSIDLTKLQGKFKLSQNRSEADRARVVDGLRRRGSPDDLALADLMDPRARVT